MRQKLITLCPNSWELAMKKTNFSQWVRSKLLEEVEKNKEQWEKEWALPRCPACERPTSMIAPSHCSNHELHLVIQ